MAKYERAKQRIISHMKETGIDVMTSHDMIELIKYNKNGRARQTIPRANDLAQSIRRDVRFKQAGFARVTGVNERRRYDIMLWELSDRA